MSDFLEVGQPEKAGMLGEFALALESVGDGVTIVAADGRIKYVNVACEGIYGYSKAELTGKPHWELFFPDEPSPPNRTLPYLHGEKWKGEISGIRKGGERFRVLLTMTPMRNSGHQPIGTVGVHQEVSDRIRVGELLQDRQGRLEWLADHAGDAFFAHDRDGRIIDVNRSACESLGYSRDELLDLYMGDIDQELTERDIPLLRERTSSGTSLTAECAHRRKDGSTFPVESRVEIYARRGRLHFLVLARDISARIRLEEQVRLVQGLEVAGRLAGGLTHDFNNMLTPIMTYAEMVERSLPPASRLRGYVREIGKAVQRASQLTDQMLSLSRRRLVEPKVIDLNDLFLDVDSMLRHLIEEDIEMVTLLDPDLGLVRVDPGQMAQVLINLALNARDAMPDGGKLTVESENVTIQGNDGGMGDDLRAGNYVAMAVSDTGVGMTLEVQARIFDPFFSTKEEGTGLGLSTCHSLVTEVGGYIEVESRPELGTTFTLYLPVVNDMATPRTPQEYASRLPQGSETVLVVEDEPVVREVAARMLREQGYTVLEAANGHEALGVAGKHARGRIFIFTDVHGRGDAAHECRRAGRASAGNAPRSEGPLHIGLQSRQVRQSRSQRRLHAQALHLRGVGPTRPQGVGGLTAARSAGYRPSRSSPA